MNYADIHIHALWGVDDGAKDVSQTHAMVDACYEDGVRILCLTPHYHPGYFGENSESTQQAFQALVLHTQRKYPDLQLFLGNELHYSPESVTWLTEGKCRSMNDSDYVLVDFSTRETSRNISKGLDRLLNAGYIPILAHAERYENLTKQAVSEFSAKGIWIQVDTRSLFGDFGFSTKHRAKSLLRSRLADLVSSDAHNLTDRPTGISAAYRLIERKFSKDYADAVCYNNALWLLTQQREEGMVSNHESNQ